MSFVKIKKGDQVRAISSDGVVIIGTATNEIYLGGTSHLVIDIANQNLDNVTYMDPESLRVQINVNFWDVTVLD